MTVGRLQLLFISTKCRTQALGFTLIELLAAIAVCVLLGLIGLPKITGTLEQYQLLAASYKIRQELEFLQRQTLYRPCQSCGLRFFSDEGYWRIWVETPHTKRAFACEDFPLIRAVNAHVPKQWLPVTGQERTLRAARVVFSSTHWQLVLFVSVSGRTRVCTRPVGFLGLKKCASNRA